MAKPKRRRLTDIHRAFIVQRLARFHTPKEAADALREEYGVSITPQSAEAYDPHKRAGRNIVRKWRTLFEDTRASYLTDFKNHIPEANKAVRVAQLAGMANAARARNNYVLARTLLEQIAKEVGNTFTNRHEITGAKGGPIKYQDMTDSEIDGRIEALLRRLVEAEKR